MYGIWRPIETAPKDGRSILTFSRGDTRGGFMRVAAWSDKPIAYGAHDATHWTPLPPPPKGRIESK